MATIKTAGSFFLHDGKVSERDIADAIGLTRAALNALTWALDKDAWSGEVDTAVWRLVDAAGLVARNCAAGRLAGRDEETGRGFRVVLIPTPEEDDLCSRCKKPLAGHGARTPFGRACPQGYTPGSDATLCWCGAVEAMGRTRQFCGTVDMMHARELCAPQNDSRWQTVKWIGEPDLDGAAVCAVCDGPLIPGLNTDFCSAACEAKATGEVVREYAPPEVEAWRVKWDGRLCSPVWNSKGAAQAYLDAVRRGDRKPEWSRP